MKSAASRRGAVWTAGALALTLGTELAWHAADGRLPTTDAGALGAVAEVYWSLGTSAGASASMTETLAVPGGWYAWLAAGALRTFGRTPAVFEGVSQAVWIGTVVFTALIARRRSGDRAGAVAALLVAAMPWVTLLSRRHGIQAPEAALSVASFFLLDRDRALKRWYTPLPLALVGAALLALGPAAWIWVVALLPLLAFPGAERRPLRIALVVTAWAIGAIVGSGNADAVFALAPPERRAAEAAAAFLRGGELLERPVGAAVAIAVLVWGGVVLSRVRARRSTDDSGTHDLPSRASTAVLVAWALAPFALGAILRAGPDSWPAGAAALAILVAGPLGRGAGGVLVALVAWALFVVPQRIDVTPGVWARAILPADATVATAESPYRPEEADVAGLLGALLDATCISDAWASCTIVVDQGLAAPDADDPGRLARVLLAEDRVALSTVYDAPRTRRDDRPVDALLTWDCGLRDDRWRLRAPDAAARVVELAAARQLAAAWSGRLGDAGCVAHWLTPRGIVARPEALPLAQARVAPWTPLTTLAALEAFYQRHPTARGRQGRGSALRPGDAYVTTAPDGWSEGGSAWRRARSRSE